MARPPEDRVHTHHRVVLPAMSQQQRAVRLSNNSSQREAEAEGGEEEEEHKLEAKALLFQYFTEKANRDVDFETHQDARRAIEEQKQTLVVRGETATASELGSKLAEIGMLK